MAAVRLRRAAIGACVGAVLVAGCSSNGGSRPEAHGSSTPPTTPVATSATTTFSPDQQAVITAYTNFWNALPAASKASDDSRRLAMLQPVATDPELSQLIATMHQQAQRHQILYGRHVAHVQTVKIDTSNAEIDDCQDASAAGIATTSGRKVTVGVKHNPVTATLIRRDGAWKVSVIRYPRGRTC